MDKWKSRYSHEALGRGTLSKADCNGIGWGDAQCSYWKSTSVKFTAWSICSGAKTHTETPGYTRTSSHQSSRCKTMDVQMADGRSGPSRTQYMWKDIATWTSLLRWAFDNGLFAAETSRRLTDIYFPIENERGCVASLLYLFTVLNLISVVGRKYEIQGT